MGSTKTECIIRLVLTIWLWITSVAFLVAAIAFKQHSEDTFYAITGWSCWLGLSFSFLSYTYDFSRVDLDLKFEIDLEDEGTSKPNEYDEVFKYVKL